MKPWSQAAAVAVFAAAGALFTQGAAPSLTWLDAGELGASAWELGIAHPPGFPTFALVHKLVMLLLPLGDVAFRGNLASGLVGAAALALAFVAGRRFGLSRLALAAGLAAVALTPAFALHAVTIEVYTGLGLFVAAGLFLAAERAADDRRTPPAWRPTDDQRPFVALGFVGGLALGHHAELRLLLLPVVLVAVAAVRSRRALLFAALAAVAGALVVAYLPLRAAAEPWRDWGHPASAAALWAHLGGERIRLAYGDQMGVFAAADWGRAFTDLVLPRWSLWLAALPGFVLLARRRAGALVGLLCVADLLYAVGVNPMGLRDLQNGLVLTLTLGLGAAATLSALAARRRPWGPGAALATAALVLAPGAPFLKDRDRGLPLLVDAAFADAPPTGTLLLVSDHLAAGAAFVQVVEGARPDLAVLVRQHLWDPSSVGPVARRLPGVLGAFGPGSPPETLPALGPDVAGLRWEGDRDPTLGTPPPGLSPAFPLWAPGAAPDAALAAVEAHVARGGEAGLPDEPQARGAVAHFLVLTAEWLRAHHQPAQATAALLRATALDPERPAPWRALARDRVAHDDLPGAALAAARAVECAPEDVRARVDLARYTFNADRPDAAAAVLDEVLADVPDDAEALGLRGLAHARLGDGARARADFERALRLDPAQVEAAYGLRLLGPAER